MLREKIVRKVMLGAVVLAFGLSAQNARPKPTCNNCPATYIGKAELDAYLKRAAGSPVSDQQVRATNAGKLNVDIGVVYRGKLTGNSPVAEHDQVSEVYHILEGSATLVTGGDIADWKPRAADSDSVKMLNGPGGDGSSIRNGVAHELKPGDVVIIPAGTGHWFTKIDDHIQYLMVRLDPDKVTPLKDEVASKADLQKGVANGKGK